MDEWIDITEQHQHAGMLTALCIRPGSLRARIDEPGPVRVPMPRPSSSELKEPTERKQSAPAPTPTRTSAEQASDQAREGAKARSSAPQQVQSAGRVPARARSAAPAHASTRPQPSRTEDTNRDVSKARAVAPTRATTIDAAVPRSERPRLLRDQTRLELAEVRLRAEYRSTISTHITADARSAIHELRDEYFRTHDYYIDDGRPYRAGVDDKNGDIVLERDEHERDDARSDYGEHLLVRIGIDRRIERFARF